MTGAPGDPRLDRETPLHAAAGSAALIVVGGEYLLQLRDNKRGIFFPGHWGCFGGASDPGEDSAQTLARELGEELGLQVEPAQLRYFTVFEFDLGFTGLGRIRRYYYEIVLDAAAHAKLRLEEGSAMRLFGADTILAGNLPMTPYDGFAIWLHLNGTRLR